MVEFKSIRQTAATGLVPENFLRNMVARGECPGFYIGRKFMVNVTVLAEMLDKQSRETVEKNDCLM